MRGGPRRRWVPPTGCGNAPDCAPWPSMRRSEAELLARVSGKLGPQVFEKVFATGSQLNRREAIALVRSLRDVDGSGKGSREGGAEVAG